MKMSVGGACSSRPALQFAVPADPTPAGPAANAAQEVDPGVSSSSDIATPVRRTRANSSRSASAVTMVAGVKPISGRSSTRSWKSGPEWARRTLPTALA